MEGGHTQGAAVFLQRYADELALLASGLDELQHVVGDLIAQSPDARLNAEAQSADMLAQHARALSDVAGKLAADGHLDLPSIEQALKGVKLTDLARRLAGGRARALETGGEFELF